MAPLIRINSGPAVSFFFFLCASAAVLLLNLSVALSDGVSLQYSAALHEEYAGEVSFPPPEHLSALFLGWLEKHPREYDREADQGSRSFEKLRRFAIFCDNFRHIFEHNRRRAAGASEHHYWLDLNDHADLTHEEFKARYNLGRAGGLRRRPWAAVRLEGAADVAAPWWWWPYGDDKEADDGGDELPASVDWRAKGAVTGVKNQGQCGSCWAFSTVVAVEGAHQIASGQLVSLSEQMLVDCDTQSNSGCNGGSMPLAFEFLVNNGGIDTEDDYPYQARQGRCVASKRDQHAVTIDSYVEVPDNDEQALLRAVAKQPVSVGIDASDRDFQFYAGGVYDGKCNTQLDHGVAIVGYGTSAEGLDYWIVKNSWGPSWGDEGFILMKRGTTQPEGQCGINTMASFPVKKQTASSHNIHPRGCHDHHTNSFTTCPVTSN